MKHNVLPSETERKDKKKKVKFFTKSYVMVRRPSFVNDKMPMCLAGGILNCVSIMID